MQRGLVGSEMCIRDRYQRRVHGRDGGIFMSEESKIKYLSDIEKYELINVNDGEKYDYLLNNDLIIDDEGCFKYLIININSGKFNFFSSREFLEIPWDCVKKIGARTIILDADDENIKKVKL
eukprot:TRINITY_DN23424_c0_g1_i10.p4 TRINITY_DN23424_c0_g1~~TRINITY_DN23424_c0_g1_i10.p4  ORF type:complete len:122 (+),score=47.72 TRINITY_DN23424_c0_g1_i10:131-496(+)